MRIQTHGFRPSPRAYGDPSPTEEAVADEGRDVTIEAGGTIGGLVTEWQFEGINCKGVFEQAAVGCLSFVDGLGWGGFAIGLSGFPCLAFDRVEGADESGGQDAAGVKHGGLDGLVAECLLNGADGIAILEAMDGIGVPQGHGRNGLEYSGGVARVAYNEFDHPGLAARC